MAKNFTVMVGCYGDYPQYSLRALERVARGSELKRYCDFFIGANACGSETIKFCRALLDVGAADLLIESKENLNKSPMMRLLLRGVKTRYVLWLDDDSYFVYAGWPGVIDEVMRLNEFDAAGVIRGLAPRRDPSGRYMKYVIARPWWRGEEHYTEQQKEVTFFPLGALFMARTAFLREHDFPDVGMIKGADDACLGELIAQVGGKLMNFSPELEAMMKLNEGERRGTGFTIEDGWVQGA